MKQLTLDLDDATFYSAQLQAQKAGKPLSSVVSEWVRRFSLAGSSDFDLLAEQEAALRSQLRQRGRLFAGGDRLTRDELHERA